MTASAVPGLPSLPWMPRDATDVEDVLRHEWLITNALGGYASGTVAFCNTRRYHGLFVPVIAARGEPSWSDGSRRRSASGRSSTGSRSRAPRGAGAARSRAARWFRLEGLLPSWEYALGEARLCRTLVLVHGENTVFAVYRHLCGPALRLRLRPYPTFRAHDTAPDGSAPPPFRCSCWTTVSPCSRLPRRRRSGCGCTATAAGLRRPAGADPSAGLPSGARTRLSAHGRAVEPRVLRVHAAARDDGGARSHDRGLGPPGARAPTGHRAGAPAGAEAAGARRRGRARGHRRPPRAGRRSVHHRARRPARGRGVGPRDRSGRAERHRRLPLVHRLGPGHDDLPGGAHPPHRPAARGGRHPPHLPPRT